MELVTDGLRFPEGPVWMPDGSIILVEIASGQITRVAPDGTKTVVAKPGGGPNGMAVGPDGKLYVCNNGGFNYHESNGYLAPAGIADDYSGGRIERIDIETGAVEVLYNSGDFGCVLRGPNDIMFDDSQDGGGGLLVHRSWQGRLYQAGPRHCRDILCQGRWQPFGRGHFPVQ